MKTHPSFRLLTTALLLGSILPATAADQTATWNNTTGNWSDPTMWSTNPLFPNNGNGGFTFDAIQNGGDITVNQAITIEKYNFTAGTNTGAGFTLTTNDLLTFTGGTMTGAGTVQADGGVTFSGASVKDFISGRTLNLGGNSTWSGGTIRMGFSSVLTIESGVTLDTNFDGSIGNFHGGSATINNAGTFTKSAGAGTTTISALATLAFNNTGVVNANSGTLSFNGGGTSTGSFNAGAGATLNFNTGTHAFNAGASFGGSGTTSITGATLNFNAPVGVSSSFLLSSGTLGGTGTLTTSGATTFTGGTMSGVGTVQANGGVTFSGAGTKDIINSRTLNLGGNSTWTAGQIRMGFSSVLAIESGVTLDTNFDGTLDNAFGSGATFNNAGTFTKSAGAGTTIVGSVNTLPFNNTGVVNVNSGTLSFNNTSGTSTGSWNVAPGTTLNFGGGGTQNLNAGTNVSAAGTVGFSGGTINFNAGTFSVTGTTRVNGGTANFNSAASTNLLTLSSGTLGGTGTLTVSGAATFTGGTMTGAGTVQADGGMTFSGTGDKDILNSRILNLGDNSTWSAGAIRVGTSSVLAIESGVTLDTSFDGTVFNAHGGTATFNNAGTFTKSAGAGTTTVGSINTLVFNNTGVVNANSGTLSFNGGGTSTGSFNAGAGATMNFSGGTYALNAGASFAGAGTTSITGATLNVNAPVGVSSSFLLASGTLGGAGTLTVSGAATFTGGTMTGAGTVQADGGVTFSGGSVKDIINSRTLNLGGNSTWSGGTIRLGFSSVLTIESGVTLDTNFDGTIGNLHGGSATINNAGTFTKSAGAGTTTISALATLAFNNTGVVNANSGTLSFNGDGTSTGSFNAGAGATLNFNTGTHAFNAGASFGGSGTTSITGATLNFNAPVGVSSSFLLSSGTLGGTGTLTTSGATTFTGGTMSGVGTVQADGGVTFSGGSVKDIINSRTLNLGGNSTWSGGTIRMGFSSVLTIESGVTLDTNFDGTIGNLHGGSATINNAGTFTKSAGAGTTTISALAPLAFNNTGTVNANSGTLAINGTVTQHSGGTLTGGTWNVTNGAAINITTGSNITTLGSAASVTLDGAGSSFAKVTTALATNQGSFTLKNNRDLTTAGAYANSGTTRVEDSTTVMTIGAGGSAAYTQTIGATVLVGGAIIDASVFNLNGGELQGSGTIASSVVTGGTQTIAPGLSAGVLTIDGDLTLSSGSTLAMEIGGLTQGTLYDYLDVNGTLTLAGMLDLSLINAFDSLVQPNDVFTLATADSPILGAFSNVASGDRIWTNPYISFNVWYGLGSIFDPNSLVITGAPEPSRTVLLMTSLLGALMRRRRGTTRLEFRSV